MDLNLTRLLQVREVVARSGEGRGMGMTLRVRRGLSDQITKVR